MKTIKIIDLINKIENEEEVPKKIKHNGIIWEFDKKYNDYRNYGTWFFIEGMGSDKNFKDFLNYEVEIIEEEKDIEFEDIDEIDIHLGILAMTPTEKHISNFVNQLIRNQKELIETTKDMYSILNEHKDMLNELMKGK